MTSELFSGVKRLPATPALPGLSGPFETHPGEIIRNHRPGMLTVNGDRYGMGAWHDLVVPVRGAA